MIVRSKFSALLSGAVLAAAFGMAQETAPKPQPKGSGMQMGGMMGMQKECHRHCQPTLDAMKNLSQVVADARASNDPAKMRAALEQVEKQHAEMNKHISMCMRSMGEMDKKQGGMKGMQHGSDEHK